MPGSVHDSTLAEWGGVYEKLQETFQRTGAKCCADSAFAARDNSFIIRSAQDLNTARNSREMNQMKEATSLRQASEWGMRAVQSSFLCLKDTMRYKGDAYDEEFKETKLERHLMLKLMVLLYNYRLEKVGLNQI